MPKSVTAQTGFDAFAHNFEAYLSVKTSPLVEMMAIEAIKMIKEYLPKLWRIQTTLRHGQRCHWLTLWVDLPIPTQE